MGLRAIGATRISLLLEGFVATGAANDAWVTLHIAHGVAFLYARAADTLPIVVSSMVQYVAVERLRWAVRFACIAAQWRSRLQTRDASRVTSAKVLGPFHAVARFACMAATAA